MLLRCPTHATAAPFHNFPGVWFFLYCLLWAAPKSCQAATTVSAAQAGDANFRKDAEPWHLVAKEESSFGGEVRVVDVDAHGHVVRYLLSSHGVLGAAFVAEELREQPLFTVFALLQAVRFLTPRPRRALSLGLGANAVPGALRTHGIHTDVVERDEAVCTLASRFFGATAGPSAHGRLWIRDAAEFLAVEHVPERYDVVVHDLFSARNPSALLEAPVFQQIRDRWLRDTGVLVVNFLGYHDPAASEAAARGYPVGAAIAQSLRRVFRAVRCFREIPPDMDGGLVANLMCWASGAAWALKLPTSGDFADPPEMSPPWSVTHFQRWEVLSEVQDDGAQSSCEAREEGSLASEPRCAAIAEAVEEGHRVIAKAMWNKTSVELLPYPGLWAKSERCDNADLTCHSS